MQGSWKDLLSFNARERNGIFVLSFLIVSVIFAQFLMPYFIKPSVITVNRAKVLDAYIMQLKKDSAEWVANRQVEYQRRRDSLYQKKKHYSGNNYRRNNETFSSAKKKQEVSNWNPHVFNPNIATDDDWVSVGLNVGQIKSINKYLINGGVFKKGSDVEKMYVINSEQYERIEPYLVVPEMKKSAYEGSIMDSALTVNSAFETDVKIQKYEKRKYAVLDSFSIELNTADTVDLKRIRGIGSYYARQIIYYREKLGGFYSVAQLYEVERMREETVLKMLPFVTVNPSMISKIHINSDAAPKMVKHPYMTWNMAITIQDHRDFSHKFKSVRDLVRKGLLNEELYSKLAPYLAL